MNRKTKCGECKHLLDICPIYPYTKRNNLACHVFKPLPKQRQMQDMIFRLRESDKRKKSLANLKDTIRFLGMILIWMVCYGLIIYSFAEAIMTP